MDDDAVVEVYWAADAPQAHLVKTVLERAGIEVHVVGEMLQQAVGELPMGPATSPRVWVPKEDEARARAVIAEWEKQGSEDRTEPQAPWTCPGCGEQVDGNFDICWKCQAPKDPAAEPERDAGAPPSSRPDDPLEKVLREGGGRPVSTFLVVSAVCTVVLFVGTMQWGFFVGAWAAVVVAVVWACWLERVRQGK